ncbi:related to secreted dipeptidyl-peptidase V precursor [Phialocephala subalpina]|uniref:Dipeptidyl-peptidase V n=1 Tax=Phialocephala subalpina TaxID=576137 RepID=A0A1L7WC40_9HELO|nr:related to secreted dipeptidyl-peptidase V precursor [Phialocephala subalpina]
MAAFMKSPLATAFLLLSSLFIVNAQNATKFTPEAMLSAPRRGTALPNSEGTLAFYTLSTHSFETHSNKHGLYVMDLSNGTSYLFSNSSAIGEVAWLGDGNTILWTVSEDDGSTSLLVGDATTPSAEPIPAGSAPGPISGIKLAALGGGTYGIAFSGTAAPNGTLYNSALAEEPVSTGRMYTQLFVRHWDTYLTPQRNSIWYTALSTNGTAYTLGEPVNALNGTGFESPIPPFGGTDNYDISSSGLVFIAKDITLNQATTTKSDVYYLPLTTFTEPAPEPQIVTTPNGIEGASAGVVFSPSSPSIAFVRQKGISYESDKNRIFVVPDVTTDLTASEFYSSEDGIGTWDRSPGAVFWGQDGKKIYAEAEDFARVRLFSLSADPETTEAPKLIFVDGAVSDVQHLGNDKLLISSTSYIDNSLYFAVDPVAAAATNATSGIDLISANLGNGTTYGLSKSQVSEAFYKGDGDYMVHTWIIRPSFFKENETYPLAFYVHGGPQGSTADSWSTRWNMMVYAEQGYVVAAFNPTGSTGFGQNITDTIQNQWGGLPYNDLLLGWDYISENIPYVDTNRSIALGASYGGYMMYWIQGHELGRRMKAIFAHDGSFNTLSQYSSEELWFMNHDFNGTLWDAWDNYARWNPAQHTAEWATPMLIVHNELDYRLPIAEGLAAFNVLQSKGVPSKLLSFPDENHWVLNAENSLVWHKTVLDWLNGYVGLPKYSQPGDEDFRATLMNGPWVY